MLDRGVNGNAIELVLQWLDLASHFRLRESSTFYRDEVPRQTKTLVVRGCESARRCHEKIFTPHKTRLDSISLDLASRSAPSSFSFSPSSFSSPSNPIGHGFGRLAGGSGGGSGGGGGSGIGRGGLHVNLAVADTLPPLVREHRPVELRVRNILRGGEFSAALLALEENLETVRRDLCVLQLGLATGGPRPYQDPRFHHWCMLRLMLVLGGAKAAATVVGGGEGGGDEGNLVKELAGLSGELSATAGYLVGGGGGDGGFAVEAEGGVLLSAPRGGGGGSAGVFAGRARWPRLRELRLSCGIMGGDLEGLAECLASMPALEVLEFEGHSFRAPPTDLVAFAAALWSASKDPSYRPRLTTLHLKNFKVEGVEGLAALGRALSAERFPRLSALSFSSCRLGDDQLRVLAAALPGMSRTLKSLDLRSNYALSVGGITVLAEALEAGCVPTGRAPRPRRSSSSSSSSSGGGSSSSGTSSSNNNINGSSNSSNNNSNSNINNNNSNSTTSNSTTTATTATTAASSSSSGPNQGARKNIPRSVDQSAGVNGGSGSGVSPSYAPGNAYPSTTTTTTARAKTAGTSMSPTASAPERAPAWSIPTLAPRPPSSASADRRRTPTLSAPPPLLLESLDLSYSCLWRRSRRTPQSLKPIPPFPRLLRALGNGACPRLRYLSLAGCYLGDSEVAQLVAALESGCRALRVLDITDNLFGEAGMKLLLVALLSGRVPPHLRVILSTSPEHPLPELRAGMTLEDVNTPVKAWLRNQAPHPK